MSSTAPLGGAPAPSPPAPDTRLRAAVTAAAAVRDQLARSNFEFIRGIGFVARPDGTLEPATFRFTYTAASGQPREVSIPMLSLVAVPTLELAWLELEAEGAQPGRVRLKLEPGVMPAGWAEVANLLSGEPHPESEPPAAAEGWLTPAPNP